MEAEEASTSYASPAGRWGDLERLTARAGNLVGPGFEPGPEVLELLASDEFKVLVVGAGGLGCELLKDLALTGFRNVHVIDMDTIDVSNLNRQFLFRPADVGRAKAEVAAARVNERVAGANVVPHFCRIEEKDEAFYRQFALIVLGLDSLEARAYMNAVACGMLEYDEDGDVDPSTIKPIVDGGTEGFKGHARVLLPGVTPCFHCTLWLFPPQTKFPLCTLAETPRSAAHCVEYAKLILWTQQRPGESFDADDAEHMTWVYERARKRAEAFGIPGVTYSHTQGVVKNIIPAIASTNAIVAASCALEALKIATCCSKGMDNYMMYMGTAGVYTHTVAYERDPDCVVCSPGVAVQAPPEVTLREFVEQLKADERFAGKLSNPSLSYAGRNLYMAAPPVLEQMTRANLDAPLSKLLGDGADGSAAINVTDKKLAGVLRVRPSLGDTMEN
uniref:NEDD8-activating enzyme E1 catalytic subunit n=1 Tax=Prasinoderma coloniale TaxID=156133 RepID=A0A7R9Y511_9VIRI|eukprot:PRCOL_00002962-RA